MNNILSVKGRDNVRYIVTRSTESGGAVHIEEAVAVYSEGMQLLIMARGGSDKSLKRVLSVLTALKNQECVIYACICADELTARSIRSSVIRSELENCCVVTSEEALEVAKRYCRFTLTVPHCDENGFYTLGQGNRRLMIGCNNAELREALSAAAEAERNGAEQ